MDVDLNDDRDFSERRGCEFDQLLLVKKEEPLFDHWKALIVVLHQEKRISVIRLNYMFLQ